MNVSAVSKLVIESTSLVAIYDSDLPPILKSWTRKSLSLFLFVIVYFTMQALPASAPI